jgi:hypothetical protein
LVILIKVGESIRKISSILLLTENYLVLVLQLLAVRVGSIASKSRGSRIQWSMDYREYQAFGESIGFLGQFAQVG